jgi:hypothetical protein
MLQVEIVVLNMVMDLVVEHIVIDYLGAQALFTCYIYELVKKVKEKVKVLVQPHPNFCGRNRSVHVMSKRSAKESKCLYGELVPNDTVPGAIGKNEMDTHADTCCAGANW